MQGLGEQVVPVIDVPNAHPTSPVEAVHWLDAPLQHAMGQTFGEHVPSGVHVPFGQAACVVVVHPPVEEQHEPCPAASRGIPNEKIAIAQTINARLAAIAHAPLRIMSSLPSVS